jgi:hypothetical protein
MASSIIRGMILFCLAFKVVDARSTESLEPIVREGVRETETIKVMDFKNQSMGGDLSQDRSSVDEETKRQLASLKSQMETIRENQKKSAEYLLELEASE